MKKQFKTVRLSKIITCLLIMLSPVAVSALYAGEKQNNVSPAQDKIMGKITGTVTSTKGIPIRGALIEASVAKATRLQQQIKFTFSDKMGRYSMDLVAGTYHLEIKAPAFRLKKVEKILILPSEETTITVALLADVPILIDEMRVVTKAKRGTAVAALAIQKESKNIMDVMSAETIVKLPESDVAGILTRMPGVTIEQGKYLQVRGMPKRYNQTTLNNSLLPTTRPNEQEVPLDLFPAGIVEYINVVKTFSPELPGEFSGGLCQIQTKAIPDKFTMKLSSTAIYNTETSFKDYLTYHGGAKDWLGYDDGTRGLPGTIPRDKNVRRRGVASKQGFMPNELERFGEAFPNVYDTYNKTAPLGGDYNFLCGQQIQQGGSHPFPSIQKRICQPG